MRKTTKKARPSRYREKPWRERVLALIAQGETVATAAIMVKINPRTVYKAIDDDPDYKSRYDLAMRISVDYLEREARHRACHGVEEPVIYQGKLQFGLVDENGTQFPIELLDKIPVGKDGKPALPAGWEIKPLTIRKPSDSLMTLMLRSRRAEVYREVTAIQAAGPYTEEQIVLVHTPPPETDAT